MKRFARCLPLSVAAAAITSLAAAGCGTTVASVPPSPDTTASTGFTGYKWTVVTIEHNGRVTRVPARYDVYLVFSPNGEYNANDPINYRSGSYHETARGLTISDVAATAAGYAGTDRVILLTLQAIDALDTASATTAVTGDRLQINVSRGEWILNCQTSHRDGKANFPEPKPT